jgi:hypothetical protein
MKAPPDQGPRSDLLDSLGGGAKPPPERGQRPRLLDSAVVKESLTLPETIPVWQEKSLGRKIFRLVVRILVFSLVASILIHWAVRRSSVSEEVAAIRKLVAAGTRMISKGNHPASAPSSIVVQLNSDQIQVTAIALGHPRLAVINGKQVAEGDTVTVHTPTRSLALTLKVLEISDRAVKLSDGTQVMTVHLAAPAD